MRRTVRLHIACLGACLVLAVTGAVARQGTFRTRVDAVRVDALVTDRGRIVTGLTADDFDVFDDGVRQKIVLATTTGTITIAVVLDTSESMEGERLRSVVAAAERLVETLRPDDTALLVTFSDRLSLHAAAARDAAAVRTALEAARPRGLTAMWDALFAGLSLVSGDAGRSLVLLLTDAADNASYLTEEQVIDAVKRSGAVVDVVVAGRSAGLIDWLAPLKKIAKDSGGGFVTADWRTQLPQTFIAAIEEFRARYLLTYEPTGVRRDDGWHKLQVRLKKRNGNVQARPGYYATKAGNAPR